ncbi:MAG: alpha-ketoglutarate-dependent dioxygenase AlkB [Mycobacteriaceae bacterium]
MSVMVQASLFDHSERRELGSGAWIESRSGWLDGAGSVFEELLSAVAWRAERRRMYDRVLDVPRLVSFCDLTIEDAPHPTVSRLRRRLNDIYAGELGEPFTSAGFCLYRDGSDSVAWHGDTIGLPRSSSASSLGGIVDSGAGRSSTEDTMVAIVSLGATRMFAMRPRGGGASLRLPQAHGDLLVMGGSCQRTWEHAVPKTSAPVGPRMSIQFRPRNVR